MCVGLQSLQRHNPVSDRGRAHMKHGDASHLDDAAPKQPEFYKNKHLQKSLTRTNKLLFFLRKKINNIH